MRREAVLNRLVVMAAVAGLVAFCGTPARVGGAPLAVGGRAPQTIRLGKVDAGVAPTAAVPYRGANAEPAAAGPTAGPSNNRGLTAHTLDGGGSGGGGDDGGSQGGGGGEHGGGATGSAGGNGSGGGGDGEPGVGATGNTSGNGNGGGNGGGQSGQGDGGGVGEGGKASCAELTLMPIANVSAAAHEEEDQAEGEFVTCSFVQTDGTTRQDLKVGVEGLMRLTSFDVEADGMKAGSITTDDEGEGELFLSTADVSSAGAIPAGLLPVSGITHVEIVDPGGTVVLAGDAANARHDDNEQPQVAFGAVATLRDDMSRSVGLAMTRVRQADNEQQLSIKAHGLAAGTSSTLVVDGNSLGPAVADGAGSVNLTFSNKPGPGHKQLPQSMLPVTSLVHVELQASNGRAVAEGVFQVVAAVQLPVDGAQPIRRHLKGVHP